MANKKVYSLWRAYCGEQGNSNINLDLAYPKFIHKTSLCNDDLYNASRFGKELRDKQQARSRVDNGQVNSKEVAAFVALLRACTKNKDLHAGTRIHDDIVKRRLVQDCADALITMYARCGASIKAQEMFDMYRSADVYTWTALISAYVVKGQAWNALDFFDRMQQEGISPSAVTFTCILKACGSTRAIDKGQQVHDEISKQGLLGEDLVLGTALVDMYAKCGALEKAERVLDELPVRDVVSWTTLIAGYAQLGKGKEALVCYERMLRDGFSPSALTFTCVIKACGSIQSLDKGEQIHDEIVKQGLLGENVVLGNALIDMYIKCGCLAKAQQVLGRLRTRDVVSWSALIAGYAEQRQGEQALDCFEQMKREGLSPNVITFIAVLKACGGIAAVDKGARVHFEITEQGLLETDVVLGTALVDMYAKCGILRKAQQLLEELSARDVVSWSAIISGYAQQGQAQQALDCFERMKSEGLSPNAVTFSCVLKACASIRATEKGEQIHDEIAKQGLLRNNVILANGVVDMYAKCGALVKAQQVLEGLPCRDVISWSTLIAGYAQQGQGEQALKCFDRMQCDGLCAPNAVTFMSVLQACSSIGAADKGEQFHDEIVRQGILKDNATLGTALVDMYVKSGALEKARLVLEGLHVRDAVSWNALIAGYSQHGHFLQAVNCLEQMQCEGIPPVGSTLSCMLKTCSLLGLVKDSQKLCENVSNNYGIKPDLVHYTCTADLLGCAGLLDKAVGVIPKVPSSGTFLHWSMLLGACHKGGDMNRHLSMLYK